MKSSLLEISSEGKVAYSKGYATLVLRGEAPRLPIEVLVALRMRNPQKQSILIYLRTFYEAVAITMNKETKGIINPINRLTEDRSDYTEEVKDLMLTANIPHVPLVVTLIECELIEAKRKDRPSIIDRIIEAWDKFLV